MNTLITSNVHRHIDEPVETVAAALRRLDLVQPLRDALAALGLGQLVSVHGTEVPAAGVPGMASFSLEWQLADASRAHVAWNLSVTPFGDDRSLLSANVRAGTKSAAGRQQLLAGWPVLRGIIESHTTRLLNAVTELAEHLSENSFELTPDRLIAAA
jgi:hypothetical protein